MFRRSLLIAVSVLAFACSKKKNDEQAPHAGSGSAAVGSGSASAGSGSDAGSAAGSAAGSGSEVGSAAGSGSDAGSAAGSGSDAGSAAFDFSKLSREEQVQFMKTKVMPVMRAEFQKFDPKDFAYFGCKTCHGKDPQKSKYKMPSADLPVLDWVKIKAGKVDPKALEFMNKVVKPKMAKILQVPEATETQKGFMCGNCHTEK